MLNSNKVIISGGPGFGKTSIIQELEQRGFSCMHEVSRGVIDEQLKTGGNHVPWINLASFSEIVFEKRLQEFHQAPEHDWVFFDRGLPDTIAYFIKDHQAFPDYYLHTIRNCKYHFTVFIVSPWEQIFTNDAERKEDYKTACQLHEVISETYFNLGYKILEIPKASVKERANFVLSHLKRIKQL